MTHQGPIGALLRLKTRSLECKVHTNSFQSRHEQPVFAGGRVPIREVREVMEAGAEGSVRIAADHAAESSENSQQSLSALLSESKADWLIQEQDLEIDVDENGKPIVLGSGSFGTVRTLASPKYLCSQEGANATLIIAEMSPI